MQVHQEGEEPFESEIKPPASAAVEKQINAIAQVVITVANHRGGENENIKQILCQTVANANTSINNMLVQNIYHNWGNDVISDIAELQVLSLEVDKKDPLPENIANVGTMHFAAESIGN